MTTEGFTAQEVEEAKKGLLLSRQLTRAQDSSLASGLGQNLYLGRTYASSAEFEEKLRNLTAEQVNAAMKKYLTPDKITIIKAGDFAKAKAKAAPIQ